MENPGELFPTSWTSGYEISREKKGDKPLRDIEVGSLQPNMLVPRPDYKAQATAFEHMLKTAAPIFDKSTEDGTRFRIYRSGSIEARTVQPRDGEETILIVFTIQAPKSTCKRPNQHIGIDEKLVKITQFVERNPLDTSNLSENFMPSRCYYVVAETDTGSIIVTEKLKDGTITFQENPEDLLCRNSLAKTVCSKSGKFTTTVADLKCLQTKELSGKDTSCKKYAYSAFNLALGRPEESKAPLTAPPRVAQKSVKEQFVVQTPLNDNINIQLFLQSSKQVRPAKGKNDEFNKRLLKQATNQNVTQVH